MSVRGFLFLLLVLAIGADLAFEDPVEGPNNPVRQAALLGDVDEADCAKPGADALHPSDQTACSGTVHILRPVSPEGLLGWVSSPTSPTSFSTRLLVPRAPPAA